MAEEIKLGKLIVIDGLDGCGKSTQAELLVKKLNAVSFHYSSFHNESLGMIKEYLSGEYWGVDSLNPKLASMIYAMNRIAMKDAIMRELVKGRTVVLDRYVESNMAFQGAKVPHSEFNAFIAWLYNLEYTDNGMPIPDAKIYLSVDGHLTREKLNQRETTDIHESNPDYLDKVRAVYDKLTNLCVLISINCMNADGSRKTQEEVYAEILKVSGL